MSFIFANVPPTSRLQHRARCIEQVFDRRAADGRDQRAAAAVGRQRMEVGDRLAPVQFGKHRREHRVARPLVAVARHEADAVRLEHVQRVLDLAQGAFHVRHRHGREQAEAPRMRARHLGTVVVADARHLARRFRLAEPDAWRRDRQHGRATPLRSMSSRARATVQARWIGVWPGQSRLVVPCGERLEIGRREEMVMLSSMRTAGAAGACASAIWPVTGRRRKGRHRRHDAPARKSAAAARTERARVRRNAVAETHGRISLVFLVVPARRPRHRARSILP